MTNIDGPMTFLLDAVESWVAAEGPLFSRHGIVASFGRSSDERPKHGARVTLSRGAQFGELLVWDSGEVELGAGSTDGDQIQEHHDIARVDELRGLWLRIVEAFLE